MLLEKGAFSAARLSGRFVVPAIVAGSLMLGGCAGGATGGGPLAGLFSGGAGSAGAAPAGTGQQAEYGPDFFLKSGYCPPVQVRAGTEALVVYDKGHDGDPAFIKTQDSISNTARECTAIPPDGMTIKVGIAGRVVAGPLGKPETVTVPIRVAVSKQSTGAVLFSQKYTTQVTLVAPTLAADFSLVADQVTFKLSPDDRDLIVFVGFDDKPDVKAKPGAKAKPKAGT